MGSIDSIIDSIRPKYVIIPTKINRILYEMCLIIGYTKPQIEWHIYLQW